MVEEPFINDSLTYITAGLIVEEDIDQINGFFTTWQPKSCLT